MGTLFSSHPIVLNAEAANPQKAQWVQLLPAGTFAGKDGRGPWTVRDPKAVIDDSLAYAGNQQIVIDYDHQSDYGAIPGVGGAAPAAGWIRNLEARPGGIWGLVEWTPNAARSLSGREYRYISPVFSHTPDGQVIAIRRASLTNKPNLDLVAVASSGDVMDPEDLSELRTLLGLPDDADITAITAAVRDLLTTQNSAVPDPARYVPIAAVQDLAAEVKRLNVGISLQAAQEHVHLAMRRGQLPPALKDWGISLCSQNKPAFDQFIGGPGKAFEDLFKPVCGPWVTNSEYPPDTQDGGGVLKNLGLTDDDMKKYGKGAPHAR